MKNTLISPLTNANAGTSSATSRPVNLANRITTPLRNLGFGLFFVATLASHAQSNFTASISRAVGLSWPTTDGGMYQVQTSLNLTTWSPTGPVVVGTGLNNTTHFPATAGAAFFRIQQLPGTATNRFVGLQQFLLGAASISVQGNVLDFSNLRLQASGIGLDDLVSAQFMFDPTNQLFHLSSYAVSAGVGVYREPYFAKDNTNLFTLVSGATVFQQGLQNNVTIGPAGGEFYADLTVGQAPVLQFTSITGPFYLRMHTSSGPTNEIILSDAPSFNSPWPALKAGRYYFGFYPVNGNTVTFKLRFDNANCNKQKTAANGIGISASLDILCEYEKYRVDLLANQILTVSQPLNRNIRLTLLNAKSEKVSSFTGVPLNFRAPLAGTYYLFIDHAIGSTGAGYSGTVTITN